MNPKIALITIIILVIVSISLILAVAEFKLFGTYIPLDVSTYNMTLGIASAIIYDVSGTPINFGTSLDPASTDNSALSPVNVTNEGNVELNISVKGSEFFNHTVNPETYYFSIGHVSWNDADNPAAAADLTTSYTVVNPSLDLGNTQNIYFWVDIPAGQYTGLYKSTLYIEVVAI